MDENLQERGRGVDHRVDIPSHEQQDYKEDGPGDHAYTNTRHHDLGSFATRIGNFYLVSGLTVGLNTFLTFDHMGHCVKCCNSESSLQQLQDVRYVH